MASTEGLEPPTCRLGSGCSIQLSYVESVEEEGIEPPRLLRSTVFKAAAVANRLVLPRKKRRGLTLSQLVGCWATFTDQVLNSTAMCISI